MLHQLFILASLSVVAFAITKDDCPSGLTRDNYLAVHGNKCYRFELNMEKAYHNAETYCQQDGGHLALVQSSDINKFIKASLYYLTSYTNTDPLWIGLHYSDYYKQFTWWDGSFLSYSKLPDNRYSDENRCGALIGESGKWDTYICDSENWYQVDRCRFICEYEVSQSTTPTTTTTTTTTTNTTTTSMTTPAGRTHPSLPDNRLKCPSSIHDEEDKFWVNGNTCYYFNSKMKLSFWESEKYCQKYGGILALSKSSLTNEFIHGLLMANTQNVNSFSEPSWIGLRFVSTKDGYYWSDGTQEVYTNYEEPGTKRECVAMLPLSGKWVEKGCLWNTGDVEDHYFVCQFEVPSATTTTTRMPTTTTMKKPTEAATTNSIQASSSSEPETVTCPEIQACTLNCGGDGYATDPVTKCTLCQCNEIQ